MQVSAKWLIGPRAPEWGILWQRVLTEVLWSRGVFAGAAPDRPPDLEPAQLSNYPQDGGMAE